jgi:hypothetical protein
MKSCFYKLTGIAITACLLLASQASATSHYISLQSSPYDYPYETIDLNSFGVTFIRELQLQAGAQCGRQAGGQSGMSASAYINIGDWYVSAYEWGGNDGASVGATIILHNIQKINGRWIVEYITASYDRAINAASNIPGLPSAEGNGTSTLRNADIGTGIIKDIVATSGYDGDNAEGHTWQSAGITWYDEDQKSTQTVSSSNQTITKGNTFTPQYSGGAGTGAWQFKIQGITDWSSTPYTCSTIGTYQFFVRKLGDSQYFDSSEEGPFTLTVRKLDQPPVSSQNTTINFGTNFWPATNGGAGTGTWQIKIEGQTNWQSESWTPPTVGEYTFQIKKLGDSNYLESISNYHTLTVEKGTQTAVTSANVTVIYGDTFTISASGGNAGAYSINVVGNPSFQPTPNGTTAATLTPNTYQFSVTRTGDANWNPATSPTYTLTINKKSNAITSQNTTLYLGQSFSPQTSGGSGTGNIQFRINGYTNMQTAAWTASQTGTYSVYVQKLGDSLHYDSSISGPYSLIILAKLNQTVSSQYLTVTLGDPLNPAYIGGSGSGTWQVSINNGAWSSSPTTPTTAGYYDMKVRKLGDETYEVSNEAGPYILKVMNPPGSVTSQNATRVYGQPFTPQISGGNGIGNYQWSIIGHTSWLTGGSWTPPSPNTYTFQVQKLADDLTPLASSSIYTLTVSKAPQDAVTSQDLTAEYGDPVTIPVTGGNGTGAYVITGLDATPNTLWTQDLSPSPYTFTVYRNGDSNYEQSAAQTYTLTITKKAINNITSQDATIIRGTSFTPTYTSDQPQLGGFQFQVAGQTAWVSSWTPTIADTYTFSVKQNGNQNYAEAFGSQSYTLTVTPPPAPKIKVTWSKPR